ncbi:hypothetical protein ATE84_2822 [Aquimarina sp. MAR_2010_214]|uniref:hypothetical protein n=1 Tax=Aquimarina sp. MAR_2010_214 TaxID=1250026 RepID=UPI000C701A6E|nr:hypothetical protein [Aquimarina sp. MAR_2010_214]PKV50756.1 hypothetical protein ATE84_2822 [Aquimarina sp. MAR_2010_214]
MVDFEREITHMGYKFEKQLKKYYHRVEKKIYKQPHGFGKLSKKEEEKYRYTTDQFILFHTKGDITPLWGGGISLFLVVSSLFSDDTFEGFGLYLFIFFSFLTVFFAIYYFTKPKKEQILNRRDGLITMTGFYWQKNITMPFKDCLFAYTTGGEDGTGAFMLQAIRPTKSKLNSYDDFMVSGDCYDSMSLICWYMDKNRPLPPGDAFDEFRQQDYERRKAEGFPRPLYQGIATPEATKEQQKERMAIGGW